MAQLQCDLCGEEHPLPVWCLCDRCGEPKAWHEGTFMGAACDLGRAMEQLWRELGMEGWLERLAAQLELLATARRPWRRRR